MAEGIGLLNQRTCFFCTMGSNPIFSVESPLEISQAVITNPRFNGVNNSIRREQGCQIVRLRLHHPPAGPWPPPPPPPPTHPRGGYLVPERGWRGELWRFRRGCSLVGRTHALHA